MVLSGIQFGHIVRLASGSRLLSRRPRALASIAPLVLPQRLHLTLSCQATTLHRRCKGNRPLPTVGHGLARASNFIVPQRTGQKRLFPVSSTNGASSFVEAANTHSRGKLAVR